MALVFRKDKRKDMQHEDPQLSARHRTALRQSKRKQKQNEWQTVATRTPNVGQVAIVHWEKKSTKFGVNILNNFKPLLAWNKNRVINRYKLLLKRNYINEMNYLN